MRVYVWVCARVQVPIEARDVESPGARVTGSVSCLMWVLGTEFQFSRRAVSALSH